MAGVELAGCAPDVRGRRCEGGRRLTADGGVRKGEGEELVSIVTAVFNCARFLRGALQSVRCQTYRFIEHIVIDGGSTDGSVELLRRHDGEIDYWLSEPDSGLYEAMNKGIRLARGGIVGILNADDRYAPDAVEWAVRALQDRTVGYCYGWLRLLDASGRPLGIVKPVPRDLFDSRILRETVVPHPTLFVRKSVYDCIGVFDPSLKLAGDFEFIVRLHKAGVRGVEIPRVMADFRLGGASQGPLILREKRIVAQREGLPARFAWSDWATARLAMEAKRLLPSSATAWIRALREYWWR